MSFQWIEWKEFLTLLSTPKQLKAFSSNEKFLFLTFPLAHDKKVIGEQRASVQSATVIYSCWAKRTCGMCWRSIRRRECASRPSPSSDWKSTKRLRSRKVNRLIIMTSRCCSKFPFFPHFQLLIAPKHSLVHGWKLLQTVKLGKAHKPPSPPVSLLISWD